MLRCLRCDAEGGANPPRGKPRDYAANYRNAVAVGLDIRQWSCLTKAQILMTRRKGH